MQKLVRALAVLLVVFAIVVYARDCRMAFNSWKYCGGDPGQPGIVSDYVKFDWTPAGLFSDVLHVDGKPAARLVKYHFSLTDDAIEIVSLDGTKRSRYCGK
jgi:hypothetical protein